MERKDIVRLDAKERGRLEQSVGVGKAAACRIRHARELKTQTFTFNSYALYSGNATHCTRCYLRARSAIALAKVLSNSSPRSKLPSAIIRPVSPSIRKGWGMEWMPYISATRECSPRTS